MVQPTLLFFHRRFIRRYSEVWVLPVIFVGGYSIHSNPNLGRRRAHAVRCRPARLRRPLRERARPCLLRRPPRAHRRPPRLSIASNRAHAQARTPARVSPPPPFPAVRRRGCSPASQRRSARLKSSSTAIHRRPSLRCGEHKQFLPCS
jgi:hypothetical protein